MTCEKIDFSQKEVLEHERDWMNGIVHAKRTERNAAVLYPERVRRLSEDENG